MELQRENRSNGPDNPHKRPDGSERAGSPDLLELLVGAIVGFSSGVIGNLLADLIRQEGLSNPFTLPQGIVIGLMTIAVLGASVWISRRPLSLTKILSLTKLSQVSPSHPLLARILVFVLVATPLAVLLSAALQGTRDCSGMSVSGLELNWTAKRLKYSGKEEITVRYLDLYNRQNLSGRAVLFNVPDGGQCVCEWWGETNKLPRQQLTAPNEAKDCIFSIPFQDDVTDIKLTLNVGKQLKLTEFEPVKSFDFKIKVQQESR